MTLTELGMLAIGVLIVTACNPRGLRVIDQVLGFLMPPRKHPADRSIELPRGVFRPGRGPEEETVYTPALRPDQIHDLYMLGQRKGRPMTTLLREAVDNLLAEDQWLAAIDQAGADLADSAHQERLATR